MKILHVCSNYYPAYGGPQYTMKHLSENMGAMFGDNVEIATSNSLYGPEMPLFKAIEPAIENINGVMVHRFPFNRWHYPFLNFAGRGYKKIFHKTLPHKFYKYRWELDCKGIDNMMAESDADVIMATTANYMFCDYPLWRFKNRKAKPFVLYGALHLHINWPKNSPVINRSNICDCYIANTEYERVSMIGYGVAEDKIVTIGTGINPDEYKGSDEEVKAFRNKYGIKENDLLIAHIGRLSAGKGAGVLLDAFIDVYKKNKHVKLLLAGTSTDFVPELQETIMQQQLPVILLEDFDNAVKPLLFNATDIFVLASKGESFGVVFLEAWACKKPVIGVGTGAVASLITEHKDGLLFTAGNKDVLAQKIAILVNDEEKRRAFGINGFNKIINQYTWPVITKKYRDAYLLGIEHFKRMVKDKMNVN